MFSPNDREATDIVGRQDLFKDKEEFLKKYYEVYGDVIEKANYTSEDIEGGQIRYCNHGYDGSNERGYYLVSGDSKGVTEVYYLSLWS